MFRYIMVTDNAIIENLLDRLTTEIIPEPIREQMPIYTPMTSADEQFPEFTADMFPFPYEFDEEYSISKIYSIKRRRRDNIINSIDIIWNPSWISNLDSQDMPEVKLAYWTHVSTSTPLVDICPLDDGLEHNVRRVISHEFIYDTTHNVNEPTYLVEWMPETVTLEKFRNVNFLSYKNCVQNFVIENNVQEFDQASRNVWFN
ncbi:hypothetical protein RDWZM_010598 [Blomia tropicalis]|uniref:Uncharacterized protein n=1 Tax=Blomia tropicalis TaxID=40697 RepID=A0A9Q0RHU9_BLOTA|nr:hypothetical protein BLOT_009786 [Blomia tropicalis]KAJ6216098.1 hypothetical protein RDWZM_010598 [Blomia tropicalis]